jgi:hypothetical protein
VAYAEVGVYEKARGVGQRGEERPQLAAQCGVGGEQAGRGGDALVQCGHHLQNRQTVGRCEGPSIMVGPPT